MRLLLLLGLLLLLLLRLLLLLLFVLFGVCSFWRFMVLDLDFAFVFGVGCFRFNFMVRERLGGVWARFVLFCDVVVVDLLNILYMYHPFAPKS